MTTYMLNHAMNGQHHGNELHDLAIQVQQRNRQALERLLADAGLRKLILTIAYDRKMGEHAEDIVQNVCLRITEKLSTWQGHTFMAWVSRMTVCCCLDWLRKEINDREHHNEWGVMMLMQAHAAGSPHDHAMAQERAELLRAAVNELKEPCRQIWRCYFFEQVTKADIQTRLNLQHSAFHEAWGKCYAALMRKVQNFLKYGRKRG